MSQIEYEKLKGFFYKISNLLEGFKEEIDEIARPKLHEQMDCFPKITLCNGNLIVNEIVIPLSTRPRTLRLLESFLNSPEYVLTRQEIVRNVYQDSDSGRETSPRLLFSQYQNMLKLMSRSRSLLESAINQGRSEGWIEWFIYEESSKTWRLFRLKH